VAKDPRRDTEKARGETAAAVRMIDSRQLDDAERCYDEALSLSPDNAQVAENLARVYVRMARKDDKTRKLLQSVVMKSDRSDWVAWARRHYQAPKFPVVLPPDHTRSPKVPTRL
jgi:hypothetical protein